MCKVAMRVIVLRIAARNADAGHACECGEETRPDLGGIDAPVSPTAVNL
jgi:hypothetical protein